MYSPSGGNGGNNGDGNSQSNQPQGTEYTLQGVMRFLQTEWHRHERDRNGWEIERQEMRGRIANLEGQTRRNTRTTVGLNKYISMLEKTIRDLRDTKSKDGMPDDALNAGKGKEPNQEMEKGKENSSKLKPEKLMHHNSFLDVESESRENKVSPDKAEVRGFLDHCQQEFTYLMMSPSNPAPPREPSPPPPRLTQQEHQEHLAAAQAVPYPQMENPYSQQPNMHRIRDSRELARPSPGPPNHLPPINLIVRNPEPAPGSLVQNLPNQKPLPQMSLSSNDWRNSISEQSTKVSVTEINPNYDDFGRPMDGDENSSFKETGSDTEPWDFGPDGAQFVDAEQKPVPQRPDTDLFPVAQDPPKSPGRGPNSHKRKTSASGSMAKRKSSDNELSLNSANHKAENGAFKVRFGLRGHLDAVRSVIFTGGGSPSEPEICTAGDDGSIKRWIIPARYDTHAVMQNLDLDIQSYFTHRGHTGSVMALASWSPSQIGGRAQGDGWIFSGGQDASVRVWERGRVDPKATLDGHTDAVWAICVLPGNCGSVFGQSNTYGGPDRIILVSGAADATVRVWSISPPPQLMSPGSGSGRRGAGGRVRGNSMSSGTGFPTSPQPSVASNSPFHYTLIHTIQRPNSDASPTCITPLSGSGDNFVVSYSDAAVLVYDTRTGEELVSMASFETYDGTPATSINAVVATTTGLDGSLSFDSRRGATEEESVNTVHGATGSSGGVEGIIISGHEDCYIRFYDANSGQCTYTMLAHPAAISALSLSPDGRELVSAGHDASLRFWSLEKRSCTQEITPHKIMRGEGVCSIVWSLDGRFVLTGGGDSVVKVFAR